jgi:hypothetical protein
MNLSHPIDTAVLADYWLGDPQALTRNPSRSISSGATSAGRGSAR